MSNDKEWLIKRVENYIPLNDKKVGHVVDNILDIIHQLDEPETHQLKDKIKELEDYNSGLIRDNNQLRDVLDNQETLSQEWIDKNVVHVRGLGDIIEAEAVENLLVPKQELPVIPQWVADNIESKKRVGTRLNVAMSEFPEFKLEKELGIDEYECNEIYARAWLDGYEVQKEKLYYVLNRLGDTLLVTIGGEVRISVGYAVRDDNKELYQLTEKQIKDFDERYWEFAVEVAE